MDLFIYGTLRDDALVERLTGKRFARMPAVLARFRKIALPGRYPWIEASAADGVEGFVLEEVDLQSLRHIDAYEQEGVLYRRIQVMATVAGAPRVCATYVGIPNTLNRFEPE